MASNLNLSNAAAAAMAAALCDYIDTGASSGRLRLYDGTQAADADTGVGGSTLLAELTFSEPCETSTTNGVITFDTITADSSANASGTAAWFRIVNGNGDTVLDGTVGTSSSDLNINTTSIVIGANVAISAGATLTVLK